MKLRRVPRVSRQGKPLQRRAIRAQNLFPDTACDAGHSWRGHLSWRTRKLSVYWAFRGRPCALLSAGGPRFGGCGAACDRSRGPSRQPLPGYDTPWQGMALRCAEPHTHKELSFVTGERIAVEPLPRDLVAQTSPSVGTAPAPRPRPGVASMPQWTGSVVAFHPGARARPPRLEF